MAGFAPQREGVFYLTEGGQETEIQYRHGYDLPEFAMYPLLDNPAAMSDLKAMYGRVLDVAAEHGFIAMLSGLDYRGSPDWGERLGYSRDGLADALERSIDFLRDVARPYEGQVPGILIGGQVGPRGDAYSLNRTITADEAEEYHSFQLDVLAGVGVDFVWAATFNTIAEALGVARAAARIGVPLGVSFMLDGNHRLKSGPGLRDAIEAVDAQAGEARPDYYGINCSHPIEFEPALEPGDWIGRVRSLRPNASAKDKIELCSIGHLEEGDPVDLGQRIGALAERYPHIDIFGGCCGTWANHLDQIAGNVRRAPR
ncbi:homocysteine S-methyltransferase family protein [Sphingomonas oryzagri]|uniref:Homocysteine S-methyltransferase family protein n=1 Tax=Sphingomonas oryzagri TaxID=3042314 RepID=A0ABT6N3U6_9SPHN|nr:homocysteine S-methyltransferase family protein [Sphingomonas oryzagri]MDH7639439.1 homocysteine S-methyltransferase family protein [Sphingomonas oryzagri]